MPLSLAVERYTLNPENTTRKEGKGGKGGEREGKEGKGSGRGGEFPNAASMSYRQRPIPGYPGY